VPKKCKTGRTTRERGQLSYKDARGERGGEKRKGAVTVIVHTSVEEGVIGHWDAFLN